MDRNFLTSNLGESEILIQKTGTEITVLMSEENILIIGTNEKILQKINFSELITLPKYGTNGYKDIITIIKDITIWLKVALAYLDFGSEIKGTKTPS